MAQSGSGGGGGGGEIEVPNGIYIQDTDGALWRKGTWDGSADFFGIAVKTELCAFVFGKPSWTTPMTTGGAIYDQMPTYSSASDAWNDYDGFKNTGFIASSGTARYMLEDPCFPGNTIGYIPSLGELLEIADRYSAISELYNEATGEVLDGGYYWSSSFKSLNSDYEYCSAYVQNLSTRAAMNSLAYNEYRLLPCCKLYVNDNRQQNRISVELDYSKTVYAHSDITVGSNLVISIDSTDFEFEIEKGDTRSTHSIALSKLPTITSVTPSEDDHNIYVF